MYEDKGSGNVLRWCNSLLLPRTTISQDCQLQAVPHPIFPKMSFEKSLLGDLMKFLFECRSAFAVTTFLVEFILPLTAQQVYINKPCQRMFPIVCTLVTYIQTCRHIFDSSSAAGCRRASMRVSPNNALPKKQKLISLKPIEFIQWWLLQAVSQLSSHIKCTFSSWDYIFTVLWD